MERLHAEKSVIKERITPPMYTLSEMKELMKLIDRSSIQHVEIENEHGKISIRKAEQPVRKADVDTPVPAPAAVVVPPLPPQGGLPAPAPAAHQGSVDGATHVIVSPMVGTFYAAAAPDAPPFLRVGDTVQPKTVVCIIEAMKLMNEIEAETTGRVVEVLVTNGQLVEFGQPLFRLDVS